MYNNKYFFQDFLFKELPVDKQDNPIVDIEYDNMIDKKLNAKSISFDKLLRMDKIEEWERLYEDIKCSVVYIIDDVSINNSEVQTYKDFYMRTYYYNISSHCKKCFVVV